MADGTLARGSRLQCALAALPQVPPEEGKSGTQSGEPASLWNGGLPPGRAAKAAMTCGRRAWMVRPRKFVDLESSGLPLGVECGKSLPSGDTLNDIES
jgi:hypothetical protein